MPSYSDEYNCKSCGHTFGKLGSSELLCPRCGSEEIERNHLLFGLKSAEELTPDDYFDACLVP